MNEHRHFFLLHKIVTIKILNYVRKLKIIFFRFWVGLINDYFVLCIPGV